jgi:transcriptional regulator PpsR
MTPFTSSARFLSDLSAEVTGKLVAAAADVALIVDAQGVIRDMAFGSESLKNLGYERWIGQPWVQTVAKDSHKKIEALLRDGESSESPRWRQVNHESGSGPSLPLSYCAVKIGAANEGGTSHSVVYGRDLRAIVALQQSLVDAQQASLNEHWRLRDAQSRFRYIFHVSSEAILLIDAASQKVQEANPAALGLFESVVRKLVNSSFPVGFDPSSHEALQGMILALRSTGKADDLRARLLNGQGELTVSGSLLREEAGSLLVLRLAKVATQGKAAAVKVAPFSVLPKLMQSSPDCIVVTDIDGNILTVNDAFVELLQVSSDKEVIGEALGRWLGRTGIEMNVLISTLRQRGSVRLFPTALRGEQGSNSDVEISATMVNEGGQQYLCFTLRDVSRRLTGDARASKEIPRSVGQLSELVGRVPMKDIVGETTDLIEQLCIEAALDLTRDNRAAAAEMLGLSRQSLYVKLRRYGLSDPIAESEK